MCNMHFHDFCLQLSAGNHLGFVCPYCTISHLDPLNKVVEALYKPAFLQFSLIKNERTIYFEVPSSFKAFNISIRCLRLDGKNGLDDTTWPDYGDLFINQYKIVSFQPLPINYSLKKRRDEPLNITKQVQFDQQNKLTIIETRPDEKMKQGHRILQGAMYLIGIFATMTLTPKELITDVKQNPRNFLSVHESRK